MAGTRNRHYRPISARETGTNDGLSVRGIRDLTDSVNNYAWRAGMPKIIKSSWPSGVFLSPDSATVTQNVRQLWAPRLCPSGPTCIAILVGGKRILGAGNITVRICLSEYSYTGPEVIDTAFLSTGYTWDSIIINNNNPDIYDANVGLPHAAANTRDCFFVLTMQNAVGSQAELTTVDIRPIVI